MNLQYSKKDNRRGAALLIVLFIVMTITILSLGFLSRSDSELTCGRNMLLREQADSLAYSGLEHAKGLLLYPQDLSTSTTGYWQGASSLQLVTPGSDYYDVSVAMHNAANDPNDLTYRCTYDVNCEAYRLTSGTKIGRSSIKGVLRLDPCIAYWTNVNNTIPSRMNVYGDTYCNGNILNLGILNGDVFASALTGTASGQTNAANALTTVAWPNVTVADFTSASKYSVQAIPATVSGASYGPYTPAKVFNCSGNMSLQGSVNINGMLVVQGDLQVTGTRNNITAGKNLPALYVTGDVIVLDGGELNVTGLAVVDNRVRIRQSAGNVNVYGGLFTKNGVFEAATDSSGNNNTAFLYNGPAWVAGTVNGAASFDGVDDYMQTTNSSSTLQISNDYTFSVWVKPDASQKIWAGIFSKANSDGSGNHWTLQFDTSSPRKLIIYHPSGSWDTGITLPAMTVGGVWHSIAIVRHKIGLDSYMWSYLDGAHVKTMDKWNTAVGNGNGHLNIGGDMTASSSYVFKGLIDELKIYDSSAADGSVNPPGSLIGYWSFDKTGTGAVNVYASPDKAAVVVWSGGNQTRWGQAGGAFFRSIKRN